MHVTFWPESIKEIQDIGRVHAIEEMLCVVSVWGGGMRVCGGLES
jgi:hypothetical protein